jgi:hypothetical protein
VIVESRRSVTIPVVPIPLNRLRAAASTLTAVIVLAGCGLNETSPDLFLLKRTGQGQTLTVLVNDGGTIRCDGRAAKPISDQMLLQARDLATTLDNDAKAKLEIAAAANSVAFYSVRLQDGTITFPDTAASTHHELAQAELFAVQAEQGPCSG